MENGVSDMCQVLAEWKNIYGSKLPHPQTSPRNEKKKTVT